MNINLVTVQSGWILQKIAERTQLANTTPANMTVSFAPMPSADVNVYVDIYNCFKGKTAGVDIGLYTHMHANSFRYVDTGWKQLDFIIHMCGRYRQMFEAFYPAHRMAVLQPGEIPAAFSIKKLRLGIVQRGGHIGKGSEFMASMTRYEVMKDFQFCFVGDGWEGVVAKYSEAGIEAQMYSDKDYGAYPKLYQTFDFLLIPSLWEGGPMSVFEAYGTGLPIISADVGWMVQDIPVEASFPPGDHAALAEILAAVRDELVQRRNKVAHCSYEKFAQSIFTISKGLLQ